MNHELHPGNLLDEKGNLIEAGYSTKLVKKYDRKMIKGDPGRIKEWDYYYVGDDNYGVALTIDDNSYMGLVSLSILNFKTGENFTNSPMRFLTYGKVGIGGTSEDGDIKVSAKGYDFQFLNNKGNRRLIVKMAKANNGEDFECDIALKQTTPHSLVIATPFEKPRHFYYNQKINLLKADGKFKIGNFEYEFKDRAYGVLDWGRGVWTYANTWYWSSMSGESNGHRIGFNLGYGFGDTSAASENILFVDDKFYKLDDVTFNIPQIGKDKYDYMKPWTLTSKSGDINLSFTPILDRYSNTNIVVIHSKQHQVFGIFSGTFKTSDGDIKFDNIVGFAEKVYNRW